MRLVLVILMLSLGACDSAGPGFRGAEKVVHEVDGSRFTLRFRDGMAEAIRTNPEILPRHDVLADRAARAAEEVSGCKAVWVDGDPAMMRIGLACGDRKAAPKPRKPRQLNCDLSGTTTRDGVTSGSLNCAID